MIDESAFAAALDADPDNFDCRLVFADWLEDQGDARAAGMRWLGENEKRPDRRLKFIYLAEGGWAFTHLSQSERPLGFFDCLPWTIWKQMYPRTTSLGEGNYVPTEIAATRRAAEDAFCLAFATVAAAEDELRRVREEMKNLECHAFMFSCYENGDRCLCDRALNAREAALLAICGEPARMK